MRPVAVEQTDASKKSIPATLHSLTPAPYLITGALARRILLTAALCGLLLPLAVSQGHRKVLAQADSAKDRRLAKAPPPAPAPPPPLYSLTDAPAGYTVKQLEFFESYCFDEINKERVRQQLAPLIFLPVLLPAARSYSRQLAEENFFSHTDAQGRGIEDRVRYTGIRWLALGENLSHASSYIDPVLDVVASWMSSSAHRANILAPEYRYAAIGVWMKDREFFFTQVFANK